MDENQIEKEFLLELQKPSSSTAEDAALLRHLLMNEKVSRVIRYTDKLWLTIVQSAPEILEYQENVLANLQHQVAAKNFSIEKALEHVQSAEGLFKIRLLQVSNVLFINVRLEVDIFRWILIESNILWPSI